MEKMPSQRGIVKREDSTDKAIGENLSCREFGRGERSIYCRYPRDLSFW